MDCIYKVLFQSLQPLKSLVHIQISIHQFTHSYFRSNSGFGILPKDWFHIVRLFCRKWYKAYYTDLTCQCLTVDSNVRQERQTASISDYTRHMLLTSQLKTQENHLKQLILTLCFNSDTQSLPSCYCECKTSQNKAHKS